MGLRSRIVALECRVGDQRQRTVLVQVPSFPPGPNADPKRPVRIVIQDPQGNQRVLSGYREFYAITVRDPGSEEADGNQEPPGRAGA